MGYLEVMLAQLPCRHAFHPVCITRWEKFERMEGPQNDGVWKAGTVTGPFKYLQIWQFFGIYVRFLGCNVSLYLVRVVSDEIRHSRYQLEPSQLQFGIYSIL